LASTDTTVTGPCLVGRHDRCAGVLRSVLDEANGQPCECPTGCHHDQNPGQGDEEEAALEALADLAVEARLEAEHFGRARRVRRAHRPCPLGRPHRRPTA
jgi:hypothetical protein